MQEREGCEEREEREALEDFKRGRYGDTAPEVSAFKAGYRAAPKRELIALDTAATA